MLLHIANYSPCIFSLSFTAVTHFCNMTPFHEPLQQNCTPNLRNFMRESISDITKITNHFQFQSFSFLHVLLILSASVSNRAAAHKPCAATETSEKWTACFHITLPLEEQVAEFVVCSLQVATVLLIKGMCFVGWVCGSAYKLVVQQQNWHLCETAGERFYKGP